MDNRKKGLAIKKIVSTIKCMLNTNIIGINCLITNGPKNVDILCFTGHWLKEEQIGLTKFDCFKLVSN
jgi:hypothetical protein